VGGLQVILLPTFGLLPAFGAVREIAVVGGQQSQLGSSVRGSQPANQLEQIARQSTVHERSGQRHLRKFLCLQGASSPCEAALLTDR
jgi:hypothetical protein